MSESRIIKTIFFHTKFKDKSINEVEKSRKDTTLIERVCAGEQNAFDELYKKLYPMVHGIILSRVPRDEVDDIVQEVFISAYQKLHTLRDKSVYSSWFASIARNRAIEFYRRKKPVEELSENLSSKNTRENEAKEVLDTIRSISETYREVLILRLVEGMTGPEIAEKTGLKPESVRVNLHRGMKILRKKLGIGKGQR